MMAIIRELISTTLFTVLFCFIFYWVEIGVWWRLVVEKANKFSHSIYLG